MSILLAVLVELQNGFDCRIDGDGGAIVGRSEERGSGDILVSKRYLVEHEYSS